LEARSRTFSQITFLTISYLRALDDASPASQSPDAGTPAGTVVVRAAGLRVRRGGTVVAGDAAPSAGELAVFCRPVVTAPAVIRRDGSVLADGWLPDAARLGELERHLGDGVIEEVVAAALEQGRLKRRQRRRIMSYPLVIRLMIAMTLAPDASYCRSGLARLHRPGRAYYGSGRTVFARSLALWARPPE
jgi:hypothetical protein